MSYSDTKFSRDEFSLEDRRFALIDRIEQREWDTLMDLGFHPEVAMLLRKCRICVCQLCSWYDEGTLERNVRLLPEFGRGRTKHVVEVIQRGRKLIT